MRLLIQRVTEAAVTVAGETVGEIGAGLLVFVGIAPLDTPESRRWCVRKLLNLRIFEDEAGKMNRSVQDATGGVLIVSQFTLYGDARKGNRPSFTAAAHPSIAEPFFEAFVQEVRAAYPAGRIETGRFGAHMQIRLLNDGPVTLWLESPSA